jgi:uncharacterized protein YdhG (YjbR/CyaY superfamily)
MRTAWHTLGSQHGLPARPTSVPEYLASLPSGKRAEFEALRDWVRGVLPDAAETMSYKMPTYEGRERICAIAAQKRYFALHICETDTLERHRSEFEHLNVGKGCIRFAHLRDLPRGAARKLLREAARELA